MAAPVHLGGSARRGQSSVYAKRKQTRTYVSTIQAAAAPCIAPTKLVHAGDQEGYDGVSPTRIDDSGPRRLVPFALDPSLDVWLGDLVQLEQDEFVLLIGDGKVVGRAKGGTFE